MNLNLKSDNLTPCVKLNMYVQNAHSIRNKVDEIRLSTESCPFQIIAFFETWLTSSINDIEHFSKRYNIYRGDRTEFTSDRSDGGGVLIAVESSFNSEKLSLSDNNGLEYVCIKIKLDSCNVYVFAVYIRSVHETAKFLEFAEIVKLIPYEENDVLIVCGDFNQPGVKWVKADDGDYYLPMNVTTEGGIAVIETMLDCGLHQMCNIENQAGNVLDLVFTNKFYEMTLAESTRPLLQSDNWHKAIEMEVIVEGIASASNDSSEFYAYDSADFDVMNDFFITNGPLSEISEINDIEYAFQLFGNILHEAIDLFVPKVAVQRSTDPPWYTKELKHIKNMRRKEYKKAKASGNFDEYNSVTDLFIQLQGELFRSYISHIQYDIRSNSRYFWRFVNDRIKRNEIPSVVDYNNITAATDESKAQLFANFFENQYTQSDGFDLNNLLNECRDDAFECDINDRDILKALLSVNVNKGVGPDGVSPKLLKNCANSLVKPLTILFRKSLQEGIVPEALKNSRIVPIFKSGKKNIASNYRPIVIIPTVAKIFESVIYSKIEAFVNGKIVHNQHGFVKNRSTATNLMQMVNYTTEAMVAKCQIEVLYTDFEKAFDRVNHKRLFQKLISFGFGRRLAKWFHAYLTSRTQFVGIGSGKSRTFIVTSGVPAGSILGPLLFVIFINDVIEFVTDVLVLLFADDLKLILKLSTPAHTRIFQKAIDQLYEWCRLNKLHLNLRKCFIMSYSRGNVLHNDYTINYGQHTFERVQMQRDLGIIFDQKLAFVNHIESVVASAKAAMGFIKRTLKNKFTIESAKLLYCALVRSKLEYASIVWQPYHQVHIDSIESIQKDFVIWALRGIFERDENFRLPPYQLRCDYLNIQPLKRRRVNTSIFFIYDLLLGKIVSSFLRDKIMYTRLQYDVNQRQRNLRNSELIRVPVFRTDFAHNQPFYVSCRNFNKVKQQFFESGSRQLFRNNVISADNSIFD